MNRSILMAPEFMDAVRSGAKLATTRKGIRASQGVGFTEIVNAEDPNDSILVFVNQIGRSTLDCDQVD